MVKDTVRFNNPSVIQSTMTYSAQLEASDIAESIYPSGHESGRYGDVRLGYVRTVTS